MGSEAVIEKVQVDKVLFGDQIRVLLGRMWIFLLLGVIYTFGLLVAHLQVLLLDRDEELSKQFVLLARVILPYDQVWHRCEREEVLVHDELILHRGDECMVEVFHFGMCILCAGDQ